MIKMKRLRLGLILFTGAAVALPIGVWASASDSAETSEKTPGQVLTVHAKKVKAAERGHRMKFANTKEREDFRAANRKGGAMRLGMSATERADLRAYANSKGLDPETVMQGYQGVSQFNRTVTKYLNTHSQTYVAAALETASDGTRKGWVSFTDKPPQTVIDEMSRLPIPVEVRWGARANHDTMEAMVQAATESITESLPASARVEAGYDPETLKITVKVDHEAITIEHAEAAITAATVAATNGDTQAASPVPITVVEADLAETTPEATSEVGRPL